jgi:hypothetical protein
MASSGGLSCPDSDARMSYYSMGGIPHVVFDGVVDMVGAGANEATGAPYRIVIDDRLLVPSPVQVRLADYDFAAGNAFVTVEVEVFQEIASLDETYVRVGLCEDDLIYSGTHYHNVLRDMLSDTPLTVSQVGQVQQITLPFAMDAGWDAEEMWLWAIVQRDADTAVLNAVSSKIERDYAVSVAVDGDRQVILDGPHTYGNTVIMNSGLEPDTYDLSLDEAYLPDGWSSYFTIGGTDYTATSITLAPQEMVTLNMTLVPNENQGSGTTYLVLHPQSGSYPDRAVAFAGLTGGTDLLVIADDGGAGYAYDFYAPALETTGKSFAIWDRGFSSITAAAMAPYDAIVWFSSLESANITEDDRAEIEQFLNDGGKLFLTGQNIAGTLLDTGGYPAWMIAVLKSAYQFWNDGSSTVAGVAGDPIADGIDLDLIGGDGAGNYHAPDVITPSGTDATGIFNYADTGFGAGNRVEYGECKLVFLGFGFESINAAADRNLLMQRVIDWLVPGGSTAAPDELPVPAALYQNVPNPFNPQTTIAFSLPAEAHVRVEVYDMTGRLVTVLADEVRTAGEHHVVWDGRDADGSRVASGTYFCKLSSEGTAFSRKMTMLK